ncbi:MAG: hypothetical protein AAF502_17325 [Bacteroidota bacterium]
MKIVLFSIILFFSRSSEELQTYQLVTPDNSGEQFIAVSNSTLYYYGKVKKIALSNQARPEYIHFLSRSEATSDNAGGNLWMMRNFQVSETPLRTTDWDKTQFIEPGIVFRIAKSSPVRMILKICAMPLLRYTKVRIWSNN